MHILQLQLHVICLFLNPLKKSENLWFSDVIRGYRKKPVTFNVLRAWCKSGTRTPGPGTPLKFKSETPGPPSKFKSRIPEPPSKFKSGTTLTFL